MIPIRIGAFAVGVLALAGLVAEAPARVPIADAAADAGAGVSIYRLGMLGSGAPLRGTREQTAPGDGLVSQGADAACVNCHQRSGLGAGSKDPRVSIPPIAGRFLYAPRSAMAGDRGPHESASERAARRPYTDETLARAIREGVDAEGRSLSDLMPRFAIGDADMAELIAYLKTLDPQDVPGVTDTVLHFATIITPDADPRKRQGMLDVLHHYFADKNALPLDAATGLRSTGRHGAARIPFMGNRHWQLHVWELTGPPATWPAQLQRHLDREPVFAAISGLAGSNWKPVHDFCERAMLPCLFPNVEVPVAAQRDFYSLYFSKGVLLEAGLIARSILDPEGGGRVRSVRQVFRAGDSGEAAAEALAAIVQGEGIAVRSQVLAPAVGADTGAIDLPGAGAPDEAVVLWLRPSDVAALGRLPDTAAEIYMSGLMGGLERAPLPEAWRLRVRMAYPFDLPDARVVRVDYPKGWFAFHGIPIVAEQVQVDTYLACGLLAETLSHAAEVFAPEHLVERAEELLEHRYLTGYYPRLALAQGQSFASKGGYVVRFAGANASQLLVARGWTVP